MYFVCCQILGVKPGADEETIKSAYRKSAKELHPDINDSEKAHEYFVVLKNAYEYLLQNRYSEAELRVLWQEEQMKKRRNAVRRKSSNGVNRYHSGTERYTLREILEQSKMARVFYILFHVLFLFIGVWLLFHSVYDLIFGQLDERSEFLPAYFTIVIGLFMGLFLTSAFLITGISFIRHRIEG